MTDRTKELQAALMGAANGFTGDEIIRACAGVIMTVVGDTEETLAGAQLQINALAADMKETLQFGWRR